MGSQPEGEGSHIQGLLTQSVDQKVVLCLINISNGDEEVHNMNILSGDSQVFHLTSWYTLLV